MTEPELTRLVAWSDELARVHARLRSALAVVREALHAAENDTPAIALGDLMLYCHGFCAALDGHHRGEDRLLFPAIADAHPQLEPVLRALQQDHSMIAHLLGRLRAAVDRSAAVDEIAGHLEGIAAIMESHFRYEERQLVTVLETLALSARSSGVLGPL